jgi:hypothetical protein
MYAICSTKKNDVAKCVSAMVSKDYRMPIFQFGIKKYNDLDKNNLEILSACRKMRAEHVINLDTRKIHKKTCYCRGKNVIGARLINIKNTGLKLCGICMK